LIQPGLIEALSGLELTGPRPVLVLVGGAAHIAPAVANDLGVLFESLAPRLDALGVTLIDGGTAFGVMALMGRARHHTASRFPLLGVAAQGTVSLATLPARAMVRVLPDARSAQTGSTPTTAGVRLDPHHSHFLLVPGDQWGDESAWISAAASYLAGDQPSLTLVAAGGQITRLDAVTALKAGRRLLVLAGSGGTADRLAAWWRHGGAFPDVSLGATERALIQVLEMVDAAERLSDILTQLLAPPSCRAMER
jgi:hypothetical protein